MKIVIIGGGSAGTTCAFELRKLNKDIEILILENSNNLEYSPCALPYVISNEISSFENIFIFNKSDYSSNNITISLNSLVLNVDKDKKTIKYKFENKEKDIKYDYLILATGSNTFIPPIKGLESTNYFTLKNIDDAKKIVKNLNKNSSSVILGGGLIGIELAISLAEKNEKVILIESKENIFSSILDSNMSVKLKELLEKQKITFYENSSINKIEDNKLFLDEKKINFKKLFICTGVRPNVELANKIGLKINQGIVVNKYLETSNQFIFACGDCVESFEHFSNKKILSLLGTTAVRQAKIVANNIVSKNKLQFPQVLNNSITKIGSIFVASIGLTTNRCNELSIKTISATYTGSVRSEYYPSKSKISIKLISTMEGLIIGGQIIGDEEVVGRINLISLAIQKKCLLKEIADLETCYNPASAPIFDPLTITANICVKKLNLLNERK